MKKNKSNKVILVINAGSSSIKYKVFKLDNDEVIGSGQCEKIGNPKGIFSIKYTLNGKTEKIEEILPIPNHNVGTKKILDELKKHNVITNLKDIVGVGHRVVMGGTKFNQSTIVTKAVKDALTKYIPLAPLHNPPEIETINVFEKLLPGVKNVGVFDTSFHTTIPDFNHYPLDQEVVKKYQIYKYGMHGTSYRYVTLKMQKVLKKKNINLIICHLGNGASICEVRNGKSFNTTMGLTPLEGLMMGSRCGDVDASIAIYLFRQGYKVEQIEDLLNKQSGFKGVTGFNDCRDVTDAASKGDKKAILALEMYITRVAKYIVTYANEIANIGRIDGIVFTAGIGENAPDMIEMITKKLPILGLQLNNKVLMQKYDDYRLISNHCSNIDMYQVRTNEELMIEQDVRKLAKL